LVKLTGHYGENVLNKDIKNLIVDSYSTVAVLAANTQAQIKQLRGVIWSQRVQSSTIYSQSNTATRVNLAINAFTVATVRTTIKV
jgi:hypothetical protein